VCVCDWFLTSVCVGHVITCTLPKQMTSHVTQRDTASGSQLSIGTLVRGQTVRDTCDARLD